MRIGSFPHHFPTLAPRLTLRAEVEESVNYWQILPPTKRKVAVELVHAVVGRLGHGVDASRDWRRAPALIQIEWPTITPWSTGGFSPRYPLHSSSETSARAPQRKIRANFGAAPLALSHSEDNPLRKARDKLGEFVGASQTDSDHGATMLGARALASRTTRRAHRRRDINGPTMPAMSKDNNR